MARFTVGEEVRFDGAIYVISAYLPPTSLEALAGRYRLLACAPGGTRHVWAEEARISEIDSYVRPQDDTSSL
jgi:hypothetical protein